PTWWRISTRYASTARRRATPRPRCRSARRSRRCSLRPGASTSARCASATWSWSQRWRARATDGARSSRPKLARALRVAPLVLQELEHDLVEALGGLGHHQVPGARDRDEVRFRDRRGQLLGEARRRQVVLLPALDQRLVRELAEARERVVAE